jgi:hypothetical protein
MRAMIADVLKVKNQNFRTGLWMLFHYKIFI